MKPRPMLPAAPCVVEPSGDPHNSFLHLADLSRDDKTKWITAANTAGVPLAEWVQRALNKEAALELARAKSDAPKAPPVG